jgi:branched-chain amino acid transport system substrate-binding protein
LPRSRIKIGLGIALSGQLAANGKAALVGMKIWEEDTNAKGGLLGRPVKLVYYDDQSNPANVPDIYTKLLDVDKVDLIISRPIWSRRRWSWRCSAINYLSACSGRR